MTREQKRMVLENSKNFLNSDFLKFDSEIKLALCYIHSAIGRKDSDSLIKNLFKQKHFNNLNEFVKIKDTVSILYNYTNVAFNCKTRLNQSVENLHIADTIYYVIQFLFFEARFKLNGVSFLEHLNLNPLPTEENIVKLYEELKELKNPIRNNILLAFIRNKDLQAYGEFLQHEVYMYRAKHNTAC